MADSEKKELRRVLKTGVRIRGRRYTAAGLDKYIGCVISLSLPDGDAPESLLGRIGKDKIRLRQIPPCVKWFATPIPRVARGGIFSTGFSQRQARSNDEAVFSF